MCQHRARSTEMPVRTPTAPAATQLTSAPLHAFGVFGAGTFVVPPTRAWVDEQPELMGSTASAKISVCADCAGPTYGALPPPPKPCPADCSGNGVCNLKTGKCVCNAYWTRADCSRMVPA